MAINKYLDAFMKAFPYEGLTYDDVTLVTQYADFLPDDASLETQLTSRQKMKILRQTIRKLRQKIIRRRHLTRIR